MSFVRETGRAIRSTLVLWVITALIYPLMMVAVGQIAFPFQANGSILTNDQGQPVGSALIGQPFTSDRYSNRQQDEDNILQTGVSGASNLAPSNPELLQRVQATTAQLQQAGIQPTADLVYTSGSSLDPHITPEAARAQITRVATTRGLQPNQLEHLINQNTDGRFLGIFGELGINVLRLNLALDQL